MMSENFVLRRAAFTVHEHFPPATVKIFIGQLGFFHIPTGLGVLTVTADYVSPPSPRKEEQMTQMNYLVNQDGQCGVEIPQSAIALLLGEDAPIHKLLLYAIKGGVVEQNQYGPNGRSYEVTVGNAQKKKTPSYRRMVDRLYWLMKKEFRRHQDFVNDKSFINY